MKTIINPTCVSISLGILTQARAIVFILSYFLSFLNYSLLLTKKRNERYLKNFIHFSLFIVFFLFFFTNVNFLSSRNPIFIVGQLFIYLLFFYVCEPELVIFKFTFWAAKKSQKNKYSQSLSVYCFFFSRCISLVIFGINNISNF